MPGKAEEPRRPPFPLSARFPTVFERRLYKLHNAVYNRLYPVRPLYYSSTAAALFAYQCRVSTTFFASSLPKFESPVLSTLQKALVSLAVAYVPVFIARRFLKHVYFSYKGFLFEKPKNVSLSTKLWVACRSVLSLIATPKLRSCDALLPNLPVPSLRQTLSRYLESVEPILDLDEFERISEMAVKFEKEEGRTLQRLTWIYSCFVDNYVTNFWEKYAYLFTRSGLLINSSVAHCDLIRVTPANQAVRAAHIVYIETLSMLAMDREVLPPIGGGILCTTHYQKCYATTRIPGKTIDHLKSYGVSRHVAVYHKGCFYKVDVFGKDNRIRSVNELSEIFTELITRDDVPTGGEKYVAALTTDERARWNENREKFFLNNATNRKTLEVIESAIGFVDLFDDSNVGYEQERPELLDNFLKVMLTGDGTGRWADKSLNWNVSPTGRCGGTTEHSIGDGSEFDHILENFVRIDTQFLSYPAVVEQLHKPSNGEIALRKESLNKSHGKYVAERLHFDIDDEMESEIMRCYTAFQPQRDDVDIAATMFRDFGKGLIKTGNVSPDAFVQMAIQLANYKDQGKFVLTYESASARFYANSRTETLRTVTKESCAFVLAMLDNTENKAERLRLLRNASELHGFRNRECMVGRGVDRHLFVLYVLSKAIGCESPFLNYYISQPWLLSTSQAPAMTSQMDEDTDPTVSWLGACFGAVAKNGYGICYRFAGNHSICIHISSYKSAPNTDSHRFQAHLIDSFKEMAALFSS